MKPTNVLTLKKANPTAATNQAFMATIKLSSTGRSAAGAYFPLSISPDTRDSVVTSS